MNKDVLDMKKILDEYKSRKKAFDIIILVVFLFMFVICLMAYFTKGIEAMIAQIICCSPFAIPLVMIPLYSKKKECEMNFNNYSICEDTVVGKKCRYFSKYNKYFLKFENINEIIPVNLKIYKEIQEGELCYIFSVKLCDGNYYHTIFPCSKYTLSSELKNKMKKSEKRDRFLNYVKRDPVPFYVI